MAFKISSIGQLLEALMFNINIYLATIAGAIKSVPPPYSHLYIPQCTGKIQMSLGCPLYKAYLCNITGCLLMIENGISHRALL